jgi:hypothetical protein
MMNDELELRTAKHIKICLLPYFLFIFFEDLTHYDNSFGKQYLICFFRPATLTKTWQESVCLI